MFNKISYKYNLSVNSTMSHFISKWSVASVFNEWGLGRFEDGYDYGRGAMRICQTYGRVSRVADCIKELGYQVDITQSLSTGVFVIIGIFKTEYDGTLTYYYGEDKSKQIYDIYHGGTFRSLRDGSFDAEKLPLSGTRSIHQKLLESYTHYLALCRIYGDFQKYIQNIRTFGRELPQQTIKNLIDNGAHNNRLSDKNQYNQEGVSTIGNTLPNDIVEALRDFRSEMPSFTTEPDYEFYIPDSMIETKACPVSEDTMDMLSQDYSLDLNSTTCAGMQKQDNEMSCDSSSSDSDDE